VSIILIIINSSLFKLNEIFLIKTNTASKLTIILRLLSLGGLPPLLGFLGKINAIIIIMIKINPAIISLVIDANQFTGSLPPIPQDAQISQFSVMNNHLTGNIPDSYVQSTSLAFLFLDDNVGLIGVMPAALFLNKNIQFVLSFRNTSLSCPDEQSWRNWNMRFRACTWAATPTSNGGDNNGISGDKVITIWAVIFSIVMCTALIIIAIAVRIIYKRKKMGYVNVDPNMSIQSVMVED